MTATSPGPAEDFGDALTRPFWQGAARRELLLQRCDSCGRHQFYPRPFCLGCDATALSWVRSGGTGTVYTFTRIWRGGDAGRQSPQINALVELDEGPRLFTALVGAERFAIGQRVRVAWQDRGDAPPLPVFEPLEGAP